MGAAEQAAPGLRRCGARRAVAALAHRRAGGRRDRHRGTGRARTGCGSRLGDHSQARRRAGAGLGPAAPDRAWPVARPRERGPMTARRVLRAALDVPRPALPGRHRADRRRRRHVRGVLTTPAAPGALLDNVGQLLGYWMMATRTERTVVFPVHHGHDRVPRPAPGARHAGRLPDQVVDVSDRPYRRDAQLSTTAGVGGVHRLARPPLRQPHGLRRGRPLPERERSPSGNPAAGCCSPSAGPTLPRASCSCATISAAANAPTTTSSPPRNRRHWLLGRIAVKDAVRNCCGTTAPGRCSRRRSCVDDTPTAASRCPATTASRCPRRRSPWPTRTSSGVSIARFGRVPVEHRDRGSGHRAPGDGLTAGGRQQSGGPAGPAVRRRVDRRSRRSGGRMTTTEASRDVVFTEIAGMLRTVLDELGVDDAEITEQTSFNEDLELESIDLVTLTAADRRALGRAGEPGRVPGRQGPRRGHRAQGRRPGRLRGPAWPAREADVGKIRQRHRHARTSGCRPRASARRPRRRWCSCTASAPTAWPAST